MLIIVDIVLVFSAVLLSYYFNKAKRQSREIRDELQDILDSLEPIALKDSQGRLLRVNKAFADSYDVEFNDMLGRRTDDIDKGENAESSLDPVLDELKIADDHTVQRFTATGPMGKVVYDIEKYRLVNEEGQVSILEIRHNVTRLYRIQEVLQRQKDQLEQRSKDLFESNNELEEIRKTLEENLEEKEHEYSLAQEIQQGLLPLSLPEFKAFEFWSYYEPVSNVGGDLYDVIPLGAQRYGIFIGDVSGHGVPAAFVGALAKMSLMVHAESTLSPAELFTKMNADLVRVVTSGYYLTAFYGVLDLYDNTFTYTRASHPHPIVIHKDGTETLLDSKGLFLGAFKEGRYEENQIQLQAGDRLFFFTDGCYEMEAKQGGHLSYKHFRDSLIQSAHEPLSDVYQLSHNDLMKKVRKNWVVEDDQTFLILQMNKKPRSERLRYLIRFDEAKRIKRKRMYDQEGCVQFLTSFQEELELAYTHSLAENITDAVKEVVYNALEYGNQNDPSKAIVIAYQLLENQVKISVHDKGEGFDIDSVEAPKGPKERGYGLLIVKTYMDEVNYDRIARTFTLTKYIK